MPKFRFGLRVLLALPLCVAAFYCGWTFHTAHLRAQYHYDATVAQQRSSEVRWELSQQRAAKAAALRESVERLEHQNRMQTYERWLKDPIGARMFPPGAF
jgi:hypothetical protein